MENCTQLEATERNGNLHIMIKGVYAGNTPHQLVDCIQLKYRGTGNIFIHTEKVTEVIEAGEFEGYNKDILTRASLNKNIIYMIGAKAMTLHFPCNKIIVPPPRKSHCTGCRKCTCTKKLDIQAASSTN